jgi:hypothetical protein
LPRLKLEAAGLTELSAHLSLFPSLTALEIRECRRLRLRGLHRLRATMQVLQPLAACPLRPLRLHPPAQSLTVVDSIGTLAQLLAACLGDAAEPRKWDSLTSFCAQVRVRRAAPR